MQLISCKQKHLFLNKAKKDSFFKNPARDLDNQFNLNMTWSLRNRYLRFFWSYTEERETEKIQREGEWGRLGWEGNEATEKRWKDKKEGKKKEVGVAANVSDQFIGSKEPVVFF